MRRANQRCQTKRTQTSGPPDQDPRAGVEKVPKTNVKQGGNKWGKKRKKISTKKWKVLV